MTDSKNLNNSNFLRSQIVILNQPINLMKFALLKQEKNEKKPNFSPFPAEFP